MIKSSNYKDDYVYCPICKGEFDKFLNFGPLQRSNALCPRCGSLERHRSLWLYLENRTNFFTDKSKVLHFAPEKMLQQKFKTMHNIEYISADLNSSLADLKTDITNIKCEDNSFDVIFCYHVLEHIPDDRKAMQELLRVMKNTGWAIIMVPIRLDFEKTFEDPNVTTPEERFKIYGQADHVRIYGRDFKEKLTKAGFNVKVDDYPSSFTSREAKKYGLLKHEHIYFCTKA